MQEQKVKFSYVIARYKPNIQKTSILPSDEMKA